MWLCKFFGPVRVTALGRSCGAILVCLALVGCGFEPLYGRGDTAGGPVTDELAGILVFPIADRTGQQMHNLLRDRLTPLGQPAEPQFGLRVRMTETLENLGIREDATATRANLTMKAEYSLIDWQDKAVLFKGRSSSTNSYDILDSQFATQVAEDDARKRALKQLSDEVKVRLAVYFKSTES
jgi:LPS-assembly lipoprotein